MLYFSVIPVSYVISLLVHPRNLLLADQNHNKRFCCYFPMRKLNFDTSLEELITLLDILNKVSIRKIDKKTKIKFNDYYWI